MAEPIEAELSLAEARSFIAERLASGSAVLGMEGFRVRDGAKYPDLDCIADFSPDGVESMEAISAVLDAWPNEADFRVELLFVTPGF